MALKGSHNRWPGNDSRSSIISITYAKRKWYWRRIGEVCRQIGVSEQSYYRWRKEYGGLKVNQARRFKELERENARLKRAVADLTLDKLILKEAAEGNW